MKILEFLHLQSPPSNCSRPSVHAYEGMRALIDEILAYLADANDFERVQPELQPLFHHELQDRIRKSLEGRHDDCLSEVYHLSVKFMRENWGLEICAQV